MKLMNESQLQILAERTWDLHKEISDLINQNGFSFCSNCSNHGRYCVVALQQRGSIVAVKDSLRDVYNNILYLQRVKSSQSRHIEEALANLEESRMLVIDKINQFPEKQRNLDVLEELLTFLAEFPKESKEKMDERIDQKKNYENRISRFVIGTASFAFEYAVIFASIYSTVKFRNSRVQREYNEPLDSTLMNKVELLVADSNINHLNVLRGRG